MIFTHLQINVNKVLQFKTIEMSNVKCQNNVAMLKSTIKNNDKVS